MARTEAIGANVDDQPSEDAHLRFFLSVTIRHPDMDPREITRVLAREPYQTWQAGAPRFTPTGQEMPSVGRQTYWIWRMRVEKQRNFFAALMAELDRLTLHSAFLWEIVGAGGQVALGVSLSGEVNIGATLSHAALVKLAALPVELDVEVFPDMG